MKGKQKDKGPYGGFILTFEPARCKRIDSALRDDSYQATETFSASDWDFRPRELVLVRLDMGKFQERDRQTINGVALMERTKVGGATGKLKMRLHSPVMFDKPIDLAELPPEFRSRTLYSTSVSLKRIEPAMWRNLLDTIKALRPEDREGIARLEAKQFEDRRIFPSNTRTERLMEQRDAIGIAIDVAGLDRAAILQTLNPSRVTQADSALDLLDGEPLHEQDAIRQDQLAFGKLLRPDMRGARFSDAQAQVRVHVYDRKSLETVLGIDLLIYMSLYRAYILLQYKMMQPSDQIPGRWSYRVDQHLLDQLAAMNRAAARFGNSTTNPMPMPGWRLSEEVFFWRFCESTRLSDAEGSLVHGITLGRAHLDSFLNLPQSQHRGGRRIGYGNCHRYLNTSQFVELARAGWIGGGERAYALIEKLLLANQQGGRQTLLAFIQQPEELGKLNRGWQK